MHCIVLHCILITNLTPHVSPSLSIIIVKTEVKKGRHTVCKCKVCMCKESSTITKLSLRWLAGWLAGLAGWGPAE
jgi:hypothetical protein